MNQAEKLRVSGGSLFGIIAEQCGPCFAGDRSLDGIVDQIQRRAELYVNENRQGRFHAENPRLA